MASAAMLPSLIAASVTVLLPLFRDVFGRSDSACHQPKSGLLEPNFCKFMPQLLVAGTGSLNRPIELHLPNQVRNADESFVAAVFLFHIRCSRLRTLLRVREARRQ